MNGVEIDIIVTDSIKALELYEKIFDVERIENTSFEKGLNEAVFTIYGTRFHFLDENPDYGMIAANPEDPKPFWINVLVPDISETFEKAMKAECTEISPITEIETHGVKTAMFSDVFGLIWQLHEIVREINFEERIQAYQSE
ncbi:hypothetical protein MmiEs2_10150 [Methanimicrococcus stummii]|uniref:VOC domain-containing protein n=1 Tax=Methanimicrococcus stummii TaxID=3028294 RepID=A0AA96ZZ38_9EURY|nr:VOC family protein [Methanimicrococcus sp. Es2]WNY28807.1 hypothetical protein MmiEs2_10150 [Methanimicrococcus sp. Es2]